MSIFKIARSNSVRAPKSLSILCGALVVSFVLAFATTATAEPKAGNPAGTKAHVGADFNPAGHDSFSLTPAGHDSFGLTPAGHDAYRLTPAGHDSYRLTPAGHEAYVLAQDGNDAGRSRPLEPTYQPREPEPKSWYNGSYAFALTRSVADSTIAPAGQVPLYVLTVPIDIALLPFALIGGLFG